MKLKFDFYDFRKMYSLVLKFKISRHLQYVFNYLWLQWFFHNYILNIAVDINNYIETFLVQLFIVK